MTKEMNIMGRWFRKRSEAEKYAIGENEKMKESGQEHRFEVIGNADSYIVISSRQKEALK